MDYLWEAILLRKIVAVFMVLATLVMLFTACGDNETITTEPISTGNVSTTEPSTKPQPVTYVLTIPLASLY